MKSREETELQGAVLRVLLYYKFFKFPVRSEEVYAGLDTPASLQTVKQTLDDLSRKQIIQFQEPYYGLELSENMIRVRLEDEARLKNHEAKILRSSRIIAAFPFVRSVAISGSVSKGVMKADGDVDFFIITEQGKLWLCRTLLVLNKKLLRLNSRKYFCVNYFVGDQSLEIPDENIFTANELAHLIPVYDTNIFKSLKDSNNWYNHFLPNHQASAMFQPVQPRREFFKKSTEYLLNGKFGAWLDRRLQKATLKRWKRKFAHFGNEEFELAMRSERNVSKHHPSNFQLKIIEYLESEKKKLSEQTGIKV